MKVKLPCTLFILTFICITLAQDKFIGIKGGLSISNFMGDGVDKLDNRINNASTSFESNNLYWFTAGIYSYKQILPDLFSIQSELLYVRNGKQWKTTSDGEEKNLSINIDYLQVPWLVKLSLPVWMRPEIYTGPSISIMLQSRIKNLPSGIDTIPFFNQTKTGNEVFEYATNVFNFGLVSGIDLNFTLGAGTAVIDFRFNLDALNTFNFPEADKIRNYNFMIMAGYGFNFGGGY